MRYLVTFREDPGLTPSLRQGTLADRLEKTEALMVVMGRLGQVREWGRHANCWGGSAIFQVGSLEELENLLERVPARTVSRMETTLLVDPPPSTSTRVPLNALQDRESIWATMLSVSPWDA
jgi:muconolactone delta-isomerase